MIPPPSDIESVTLTETRYCVLTYCAHWQTHSVTNQSPTVDQLDDLFQGNGWQQTTGGHFCPNHARGQRTGR